MAGRRGLSCNDVLARLDVLSDVDSEHEDDTEESLSWDESDPQCNEVSDCYSEMSASESDWKRSKMATVVKFLCFYSGSVVRFLQWGQIDPMVLLT
jgi:hypothetical protein